MYENRYLGVDGINIILEEVRNYVKRNSNGGLSSIRFKYEGAVDFPEASLSLLEIAPGHVRLISEGIDIQEKTPGHISLNSSLLKVIDKGFGNISITI